MEWFRLINKEDVIYGYIFIKKILIDFKLNKRIGWWLWFEELKLDKNFF